MSTPHRKPRIALMGEFSAGKSTLSNLLLGARPLPERVTATRLSPVWMSKGTQAPYRVDIDGHEEPIAIENLGQIPVDETRVIRLFFEADILDMCDLIDFPGISDPNMSADVWQRMLEEVDAVIWCTHATQAWRQSEAAVWETIPHAVRQHSALLVTKFDKLKTERDQYRVTARLKKETDGLFEAMFPISLTRALAAGDDYAAFKASGGIAFLQYFLGMVEKLQGKTAASEKSLFAAHAPQPQPLQCPQQHLSQRPRHPPHRRWNRPAPSLHRRVRRHLPPRHRAASRRAVCVPQGGAAARGPVPDQKRLICPRANIRRPARRQNRATATTCARSSSKNRSTRRSELADLLTVTPSLDAANSLITASRIKGWGRHGSKGAQRGLSVHHGLPDAGLCGFVDQTGARHQ